jgi:SEC-C motif
MPFVPFHQKFPEIARHETRVVAIFNDPVLPNGSYEFEESFCDEPGCDCRRVFWYVMSEKQKEPLAVIHYGWENRGFYQEWWHGNPDPRLIDMLKGPSLNVTSRQSKIAPQLLALVKDTILPDSKYMQMLVKHYQMFRQKIEQESKSSPIVPKTVISASPKVGRNEPCPCGSGKKYKQCCLN